jgi:hypothetical protein
MMKDFMQADFLVLSATLRATYQNVAVQYVTTEEVEGVATSLISLLKTLNQFVSRAIADPYGEHALTVAKESFEDLIALLWQITWLLSQKDLNVDPLRDQLRELHKQLRKQEEFRG